MRLFDKDSYFCDDNVGRVLDRLFETGTQKIFSAVSVSALQNFQLSTEHVHFDTTSVRVYGDYRNAGTEQAPFQITHGYSKDKRPDLKQFVLSMLCVGADVPIFGRIEDGNASDKTVNHRLLSEISGYLSTHGIEEEAFIYVADSALVTEANLEQMGERIRFITRLPATYKECERVILEAVDASHWQEIGRMAETAPTKNRPGASYRVHEGAVCLYGKPYRAVVVHSSAHDQRRQKRLQRRVTASLEAIQKLAKSAQKHRYACRADAEKAANETIAQHSAYHQLDVRIQEYPRYPRGRPKNNAPRTPIALEYGLKIEIIEDREALERARKAAGCFVLLSNVAAQNDGGYSAEKILRTYKEQSAIEKNYGFLKDDQIVNALFLKRPERIEALGLILLISLLIWRLIEHTMRRDLAERKTTLPGWDDKPTNRPTTYMLTWKFKGILVLCIGQERRLAKPLSAAQKAFLNALHVSPQCFIQCPGAG